VQLIFKEHGKNKRSLESFCTHDMIVTDESRGEEICAACARVLKEDLVDNSYDNFSGNYENSQMGPKSTLLIHDGGLSTMVGKLNVDSQGRPLSLVMKNNLNRARILDSRSQYRRSAKKNLRIALDELEKLKEKMALSDAIVERAAYFYRKAIEDGLRGKSVKGTAGACLYAACRDMGTNRTIKEISKHLQEKPKIIAKGYSRLFQKLSLKVSVTDPIEIIVRVANNLKISEGTKREAFLMLNLLRSKNVIVGKNPRSVAGTILYMACIKNRENLSQKKIADESGISSVIIRQRLKEFTKFVPLI